MASEPTEDPFDTLLNLEEHYYNEGYQQGIDDGSRAGRIEGRLFGLEKGFEKFAAMGKLHGKATIWTERLKIGEESGTSRDPHGTSDAGQTSSVTVPEDGNSGASGESPSGMLADGDTDRTSPRALSPLPNSERLGRHIRTLYALTEPATFSTQNDEESVADFDDRLKRAEAKARLVENIIGDKAARKRDEEMNDPVSRTASPGQRRNITLKREESRNDGNIEDFGNLNGKVRSGG